MLCAVFVWLIHSFHRREQKKESYCVGVFSTLRSRISFQLVGSYSTYFYTLPSEKRNRTKTRLFLFSVFLKPLGTWKRQDEI